MNDVTELLNRLDVSALTTAELVILWEAFTGQMMRRLQHAASGLDAQIVRQVLPLILERSCQMAGSLPNTYKPPSADRQTLLDLIQRRMLIESRFALRNIIHFGYEPWHGEYVLDNIDAVLTARNLEDSRLRALAVDVHAVTGDWRER